MALSLPKRFLQAVALTALAAVYEAAPRTSDLKLYGQVPVGQRAPESQSAGLKLWYVDINRKGTQCLIDSERVQLWRESADKARTIRLSGPANFPTATVDFAAGRSVVDVDSSTFPVGDGLSLTISDNQTGSTLGEIVIAVLAAGSDTPEKLADALKERGCLKQVQILESSKVHPNPKSCSAPAQLRFLRTTMADLAVDFTTRSRPHVNRYSPDGLPSNFRKVVSH